jgi:predicted Zn-dependent protease
VETRPLSFISLALDHARAQGAIGAEGTMATWDGRRVECDGGRPRIFNDEGSRIQGFVYIEGGGHSSFTVRGTSEGAIRRAVDKAITRAEGSTANPHAGPADRYDFDLNGRGLDDPRHDTIADDDRIEVVTDNMESVRTDASRAVSCVYADRRTVHAFASSRGVSSAYRETSYRLDITGESLSGQWRTTRTERGRAFATVGSLPFGVGVSRRIAAFQREVGLPNEELRVCLPPRTMAQVLSGLAPGFDSRAVAAGKSWACGDVAIASHKLHVIDDGSVPGSPRTVIFDDRGVPPMPMPVIREGMPAGTYHSPETARAAGVRPTGHVVGGDIRRANLIARAGNRSRTQMLGELPWAVLFDRLEGTINPVTGRIDCTGPAHVLERGKPIGYIASLRLAGDCRDLLKGIVEISSDQQRHLDVDCATTVIQGFPVG